MIHKKNMIKKKTVDRMKREERILKLSLYCPFQVPFATFSPSFD